MKPRKQLSSIQQVQEAQQSEWDNHIIFNGQAGQLDDCPTDASSWPQHTWVVGAGYQYNAAGSMLPHTTAVQQAIWQHQHPLDCTSAKYLLYRNTRLGEGSHGVGSILHLQTVMLLLALNSGRILAEVPGTYLTDHPYCGNRTTIDTCYFQPLTHCSVTPEQIQSARVLNTTKGSADHALFTAPTSEALDSLGQFLLADKMLAQKSRMAQTVPRVFQGLLEGTGIPKRNQYYWWRAQAIAYIVRPNQQAMQELAIRKRCVCAVDVEVGGHVAFVASTTSSQVHSTCSKCRSSSCSSSRYSPQ